MKLVLLLALFLASCSQQSPAHKPQIEEMVRKLTSKSYDIMIFETYPVMMEIDVRARRIMMNGKFASALLEKRPEWFRAVLAHEIAHRRLRHDLAGGVGAERQVLEYEADEEALNILKAAGYDPWDYWHMLGWLKRLADKSGADPDDNYATHPYAGNRSKRVEALIRGSPDLTPSKEVASRVTEIPSGGLIDNSGDAGEEFHSDSGKGYRVTIPPAKDWVPKRSRIADVLFNNKAGGGFIMTVAVKSHRSFAFADVNVWWIERISTKRGWTDIRILEERDLTLAGHRAKLVAVEFTGRGGRRRIDRTYHIYRSGKKYDLYRLRMTSARDRYEELLPTFERLVKSFSFL